MCVARKSVLIIRVSDSMGAKNGTIKLLFSQIVKELCATAFKGPWKIAFVLLIFVVKQRGPSLRTALSERKLLQRCRCSTGQRPIKAWLKLTFSPMGLHMDSFPVLNPPVGAYKDGPGTCT